MSFSIDLLELKSEVLSYGSDLAVFFFLLIIELMIVSSNNTVTLLCQPCECRRVRPLYII